MLSGLCYRVNQMVVHDDFSRGSQRILEVGFVSLGGKMDASAKVDLNFHRALDPGELERGVSPSTVITVTTSVAAGGIAACCRLRWALLF